MPIYVYEVITDDGSDGEQFEIFQNMADDSLTEHPETGQPIRRVLLAPNIGGRWSDASMKKSVGDDKKLERLGFTKYVKSGDGTYEKTVGKGPNMINRDGSPQ
ncbi:MAG: FmdB family transcriptional regulator [Pirellulaceae bacterium]